VQAGLDIDKQIDKLLTDAATGNDDLNLIDQILLGDTAVVC
jgi:hypothetical protein